MLIGPSFIKENAIIFKDGRPNIDVNGDVVTKIPFVHFDHMKILPILKKVNSDLFPKILDFDEESYSYRYVEGERIHYPACWAVKADKTDWQFFQRTIRRDEHGVGLEEPIWQINQVCSRLIELKIFKNDVVKTLYEISKKYLPNGQCLVFYDLSSHNIIYNNETKKLTLIDLDGINIQEDLLEFLVHYFV